MEEQDTKKSNGSFSEDANDTSITDEKDIQNGPGFDQGGTKTILKTNISSGGVKGGRVSFGSESPEIRRSGRTSTSSNIEPDDVLCDSCIDDKKKAVRSCLVCQTSFCETHLKPHLEGAAFRDHKLLEPIRDFEARKCQLHSKTMELFCQTDQSCICYLCMFQEHKNHNTVTVEAEKYVKETELSEIQEQLHLQILDVDDEVERWQKEKDRIRNFTTNQKSAVDHCFKDLIKELQRQQEEVKAQLEQKERAAVDLIEQIVGDLQVKRDQLQDKQHDGDKLLHTTDAVLFLQEFQIVIRNAPPIPPLPTYTVTLDGEKLTHAMGSLKEELAANCRKHVDKYSKNEASKNLVEKNVENRYMMKDLTTDWAPSADYGRFGALFNIKGGRPSFQSPTPGRNLTDSAATSLNSMFTQKGSPQVSAYQFSSTVTSTDSNTAPDSNPYNMNVYPMMTRHQTNKSLPQTWKSAKPTLLTQQRPFYVNKGNAASTDTP
ncbi:tripartite motif-containing protein 29 isoform X2 [Xenopus tropicalis]|uniref:Tripartite motif-containing protein 29 isoform X2 n=1 Tax=Xenopus tropicalis TaxID=8364 RepID=A0A8J1JUI4_XENTR|nr:tripartite motif-containing protein 29 isoform X2 [Xenopus tropicalis]